MDTTDHSLEIARLTLRVQGYVQGVGYRAYAQRRARLLGLVGYAKNQADGSVEVVAEGPREALEYLAEILRRGPSSAEVMSAQAAWSAATEEFTAFTVR
jgi:acylphosphatase